MGMSDEYIEFMTDDDYNEMNQMLVNDLVSEFSLEEYREELN